jgi:hypothetical protein
LDLKHNKIKILFGEEQRIIDKHVLAKVFRIYHTREIEADWAEMSNVRITLVEITNIIPNTYNSNEGWVVKKMRSKYANRIATILPIIYHKDKVQHFSNKLVVMISRADHGESINWATIMYSQLVKALIRWEKCHKNMIEGTTKIEPKKDTCHSTITFKVMFQKWFPLEGAKS